MITRYLRSYGRLRPKRLPIIFLNLTLAPIGFLWANGRITNESLLGGATVRAVDATVFTLVE